MRCRGWRSQRGATRLELSLVVIIASLVLTAVLWRVEGLLAAVENARVQQEVGGLRAAVSLRALGDIVEGRRDRLAQLPGSNPVPLLEQPLVGYVGEMDVAPKSARPTSWYYLRRSGTLVYRVRYHETPGGPLEGRLQLAYRIDPVCEDGNGNGRCDPDESVVSARLVEVGGDAEKVF